MKLFFMAMFLVSCASNRHLDIVPFEAKVGNSFEKVTAEYGTAKQCTIIDEAKYCQWKRTIYVFKDGLIVESFEMTKNDSKYVVKVKSMTLKDEAPKRTHLAPENEKMNVNGVEWKLSVPAIRTAMEKKGFNFSVFPEDSEQIVKINFGLTDLQDGLSKRYLSLTSVDVMNPKSENWKVNVTSIGHGTDFRKILPVLMTAGLKYMVAPANKVVSVNLKENSLEVQAYRHHLNIW